MKDVSKKVKHLLAWICMVVLTVSLTGIPALAEEESASLVTGTFPAVSNMDIYVA